jgi:hypothetical protein
MITADIIGKMSIKQTIRSEINNLKKYKLPLAVFIFTIFLLSVVQVSLSSPPLRGYVAYKMQNPMNVTDL